MKQTSTFFSAMFLSINKNRNEKDKNNHGASDYHDHNYTITKANDDPTSRPNSIDFIIPNAFISLWIIAFINREVVAYPIILIRIDLYS